MNNNKKHIRKKILGIIILIITYPLCVYSINDHLAPRSNHLEEKAKILYSKVLDKLETVKKLSKENNNENLFITNGQKADRSTDIYLLKSKLLLDKKFIHTGIYSLIMLNAKAYNDTILFIYRLRSCVGISIKAKKDNQLFFGQAHIYIGEKYNLDFQNDILYVHEQLIKNNFKDMQYHIDFNEFYVSESLHELNSFAQMVFPFFISKRINNLWMNYLRSKEQAVKNILKNVSFSLRKSFDETDMMIDINKKRILIIKHSKTRTIKNRVFEPNFHKIDSLTDKSA